MNYSFIDWDKRNYNRNTTGDIKIESRYISSDKVKMSIFDSEKRILELILSKKEAVAIINALNTIYYECKSTTIML